MIFGTKFYSEDEIEEWYAGAKEKLDQELLKKINKNLDKKEQYEQKYKIKTQKLREKYEAEFGKLFNKKDFFKEE